MHLLCCIIRIKFSSYLFVFIFYKLKKKSLHVWLCIVILDDVYKRVYVHWVIYIVISDYIQKSYMDWVCLSYWKVEYLWWEIDSYSNNIQKTTTTRKKQIEIENSCGISMGLGFWPWNFQRVLHNLAEFPGVLKAYFFQNFEG